jgi:cell division transport system permease protein
MNPLTAAFTTMRRSPFQTLTAIIVITVTLFVGYALSFLAMGTQEILQYFETRPQVIGFFELQTSDDVINQISQSMQQKPYVESVKIITQEEALASYQNENKDDPLLLELVTADILPASIEVSAQDVASLVQVKQDLENIDAVEEVVFQQDIIDSLTNWTNSLRYLGIATVITLTATSFLIITALISMKVASRKRAIKIMRIIGASSWYVEAPFFFEGAITGLIGSLLGWAAAFATLQYLTPWLNDFLGSIRLLPVPIEVLALQLSIGTLVAMMLGGFAGTAAVQKMMK